MSRIFASTDVFEGDPNGSVRLRPCVLSDCNDRYVGWLRDPEVNQFLETRHSEQTLESVRGFVASVLDDPTSHLFAILDGPERTHVGNIKVGPVHPYHRHADVSYFIGERSRWGKGVATEAISLITAIAFEHLEIHRCQAGVYAENAASSRALLKAGYRHEGTFRRQLLSKGEWVDHLRYGVVIDEWDRRNVVRTRAA